MAFGNKKVPYVTSILSHDACNLSQFSVSENIFSLFALFCFSRMSDEIRTLRALRKKGKLAYPMAWQQLNTSDEVAFGWQDLYQLDFLAHLPTLDFISDRNRNISTTQTFIHCILRYSDMDKDTISKPSSFWGRQWYVLKDQIDFWAAGKRAISILLFFELKEINYDFQEIMNNIC